MTSADKNILRRWIKEGDLRLFADQLEGRLIIDFEETIKILQDNDFMCLIKKYF